MGKGYLNVNVISVRNSIPVPEAVVKVMKDGEAIDEFNTDAAGQTVSFALDAPPFENSETPGESDPYSVYSVSVYARGYRDTTVSGVQIFDDRTALLDVRLYEGNGERNIEIGANTLNGDFPPKIPESEIKELPDGNGYIVLPEPVIPEYIVVHLGVPDDTEAQNVWVPFDEYIANVASCEIYSTWPEEAIKANIIAIQSFTLNRVYTEWYRSRGYNFTITNSTAYDQSFQYGRNTFVNIDNIVSSTFSSYVTKEGIEQPLFTSYCDGARSSCAGLEQWGSKTLAEEGKDALEILKYYYGFDIYLKTAEKVSGVPLSYPGTPIGYGDSGYDVRTVQTQLNGISENYPMINKLAVDGVFGAKTKEAVMTFQQIFYLPVTGIVDFATWYKLSFVYSAINRLSEPNYRV